MDMLNMKRLVITLLISFLVAILFACIVTIGVAYIRPSLHVWDEITSEVSFPAGAPGDTVYSKSNVTLYYYDYDVFVNLKIRSTDLIGPGSSTIGVSNLSVSSDNRTFVSLDNDYKTVWRPSRPNIHEIRLYWKLDIPMPCLPGVFNFTYSIQPIDARRGDFFDRFSLCFRIIEYEIGLFLSSLFSCFSLCFLLIEKFTEHTRKKKSNQ